VSIRARTDTSRARDGLRIVIVRASEEEMAAHEHVLAMLDKASAGKTVWRTM